MNSSLCIDQPPPCSVMSSLIGACSAYPAVGRDLTCGAGIPSISNILYIIISIYVWVHNRSNMPMFCLKKLISQPWVVQKSQFLEEMTLTQYILMSLIKKSNNKLIKLIK